MNKAFVREPEAAEEVCPRCGARGESVGRRTLRAHLPAEEAQRLAEPARFCPTPSCPVAYFDMLERFVPVDRLLRPVYPKDPAAPLCPCVGLSAGDIEADVAEQSAARTKAALAMAQSPQARCGELTASGRSCVAHVQKYFLQCKQRGP